MKILNMIIPILMHFRNFISNGSIARRIKLHAIQQNVIKLMMSKNFRQYIPKFCRYQTRCRVTKANALECTTIIFEPTEICSKIFKNTRCLDKQCRPRSDCFFLVCYSAKHFVKSSPDNQHKCSKF